MARITNIVTSLMLSASFLICDNAKAEVTTDSCTTQLPGDLNSDGAIDSLDLNFFQQFWWGDGPEPTSWPNADLNGDCFITDADLQYLDSFLNSAGQAPVTCTCLNPTPCRCVTGDSDYTGSVTISDAVRCIGFIFAGGPRPAPWCGGDTNCDCIVSISDCAGLIIFIFQGGSLGCNNCDDWITNCAKKR